MDLPVLAGIAADGTPDQGTAMRAARAWDAGGLVALPTETVYGLAADAEDAVAVARIYQAKGRPADHPLIVHVADRDALAAWSAAPNPEAEALAAAFWPGPLTLVVRRSARAGDHITGGQGTVAVRSPGHPVALACLRALAALTGDPARGVAAPSANRFGRVSPTTAADVVAEVGDRLEPQRDLVVDGGACGVGLESTIVDCTATVERRSRPRVLRPGAISQAQIDEALAGLAAADGSAPDDPGVARVLQDLAQGGAAPEHPAVGREVPHASAPSTTRAPGTLESHYAPAAAVSVLPAGTATLTSATTADAARTGLLALDGIATPPGWVRLAAPRTVTQYAHDLYAALRRADRLGLVSVVAVLPGEDEPLAAAIVDRLTRAANH